VAGLKVTREGEAEPLSDVLSIDATYSGDDADITTGLPLDGLLDVTVPSPVDGDGIVWRDADAAWVNEHALTEGDVLAMLTPDIYACASLTATTGSIAAGAHTDLHAVGGTTVQVNEVTGAPGFDIRAAFTGVDGITDIYVHGYYTATHTVTLELYNYDTTSWDVVITFPTSGTAMTLLSASIADGSPYFDGGGNAVVRFYHAASGNITHRLYLDYLALSHTTGGTGGLALNDLSDVNAPAPDDGDVLTWDDGAGEWIPVPGGGSPATTVESETTWGITPAVGSDAEYARQDHTHGSPADPASPATLSALGFVGALLISDTPSTPLVFADLIQNEAEDDLVYADL